MTATECINYIDAIEPNAYNSTQKLMWISECEGRIYTGLFLAQPYEFTAVTDGSRVLALPAPYDRIYYRYLQAMIHYANGEYDRYANSMAVFNEAWGELNRWFGGDYDVTDLLRNKRFSAEITNSPGSQTIMTIPAGCAIAAGRIVTEKAFTSNGTATAQLWLNGSGGTVGNAADLTALGGTPVPMLFADRGGTELGITLSGSWIQAGSLYVTGHLLIPDEEWIKRRSVILPKKEVEQNEMDNDIRFYPNQAVSAASSDEIFRITDEAITADTVVLEVTFANPGAIQSDVAWTSYDGYIRFVGTCAAATTADVTLGQRDN